ncbi:MAG: HNH endonuclease [Anaerolineae bacterium]|nr:HNH endonuclease [Anaerolineae bacterium]
MDIFVPSLNIWSFYAGGDSNAQLVRNFSIGIQNGVWGSEYDSAFTESESTVQSGDYIFFTCGYKRKKDGPNQNRYKDVETLLRYFEQFNRLVFARVTSNVYRDNTPIWEDGVYPVRFNFEVIKLYENYPLSSLMEIFSNENLDVFRRSMIPPVKTRLLDGKHINFEKLGITYIQDEFTARVISDLGAIEYETEYFEGNKKQRYTNYYERNPRLRARAVEIHGTTCMACGFNFEKSYLERGKDFIEVHHTKPVSELGESTKVDPGEDLIVLCSNCHRMVHRKKDNVLFLEELRSIVKQAGHEYK